MRSLLFIIQFGRIWKKQVEQSSRDTLFSLLSFIPLLFLNVFRVSVLEASTCIMMPLGNRFCLYSPWCSFEVFQVKGTKEALTIWHCFYCLTKEKMYFNFPRVSGMIKQAVFISTSHFQQTSNCEQRTVKTVLERNQHSSIQPAYVLLSFLLHKPASFSWCSIRKQCVQIIHYE